jgi:hypothetical protein
LGFGLVTGAGFGEGFFGFGIGKGEGLIIDFFWLCNLACNSYNAFAGW